MKKHSYIFLLIILSLFCLSNCRQQFQQEYQRTQHPEGQRNADLGNGSYLNPILGGDYPDPSILKVDEAWYMTHSSFKYAPGLLIWKSYDLVNWEPVCNALTEYLGSVFAPDLIEHKGKYYIYFPVQNPRRTGKRGFSNYVVVANHPEGPWQSAIDLKVGRIDPGHITDDDGNRYLHLSAGYMVPIDESGTKVTGKMEKVYDGWEYPKDWLVEGKCLESPKLLKRNNYYYLTSAQGGTAGPYTSHMVISSRSETPWGPWEHSPFNPIIKTYSANETWLSKGHGTIFEGPEEQWYCMYHGYQLGFYTLGRQTLMEPIEWTKDNWFRLEENIQTDKPIEIPEGKKLAHLGNLSDDFNGENISLLWRFWEEYDTSRFWLDKGKLHLQAKGTKPANSAPMLIIPTNESYEFEAELEISEGTIGGLLLFYSPKAYVGIGINNDGMVRYKFDVSAPRLPIDHNNHIYLRIRNINHQVHYYYSLDGENWNLYIAGAEVSGFHHNTFGEFVSLRAGIFAVGEGLVKVNYFKYKGL